MPTEPQRVDAIVSDGKCWLIDESGKRLTGKHLTLMDAHLEWQRKQRSK